MRILAKVHQRALRMPRWARWSPSPVLRFPSIVKLSAGFRNLCSESCSIGPIVLNLALDGWLYLLDFWVGRELDSSFSR
jgi:hypothetical protein